MAKKRKNPKMLQVQRSIGFYFYQQEFFHKYPDFKPEEFCRSIIDEQIKMVDPDLIPEERKNEKTT